MYPKSGDPSVTLVEESMLYPDPCTDHAFMDWGMMCHVVDEEGKDYYMDVGLAKMKLQASWGAMPFGTEDMDSWNLSCRTGEGPVYTPEGTIYKVAEFNGITDGAWHPYPGGTMQFDIDEEKNCMTVTLDNFLLEIDCNTHVWHCNVEDKEMGVAVDFYHKPDGYPFWYSKDDVRILVDHLQAVGYNWPGQLEGTLTIKGVEHKIHGFCSRERCIVPDQSNVEAGGWLDLIMVHFDELFTGFQEFKLSQDKGGAIYIRPDDAYFATKDPKSKDDEWLNFDIKHEDWAWVSGLGVFIPTTYIVKVECELGRLDFVAKACGCKSVAQRSDVEVDVLNITLDVKDITGTFTYNDGRVMELHNGYYINNIVCWRAFPSWLPFFGGTSEIAEVNPMKKTQGKLQSDV